MDALQIEPITIIYLSNVAPNGYWWSIPNIISHLVQYLPISCLPQNKTLCKHWYKVMNHQFLKEYICCLFKLTDESVKELEIMLFESKNMKMMVSSYAEVMNLLVEMDKYENMNLDYVERIKLLSSEYEKTLDLGLLKEITNLTKFQMTKHNVENLKPLSIWIDKSLYVCNNYKSIRSVLLKEESVFANFKGLYVMNEEKEFIVVLNNGYPIKIGFYLEAGRYDGRLIISINGHDLYRFDWLESSFEESHDLKLIKLLRNVFDFKLDTPQVSDEVYQTILYAWLTYIGPLEISEIPHWCYGPSILHFSYKK